ncbi:ABC transporter permease [Dyadobacter luticola]|uniref:FtsX-like permease family protein n=1 Tax=Dyadobacter luticola TaxID=1979387 RepID=A0A5R9KY41_9BACT|nr:ABC transporter permease [Dyadobacter luticola]TLV01017.1 FtsX-like permease family protein [Dyadobacter luticola]
MFKNYFKIARRNLWRNKAFSAINILGLALGMAACFFVFQYVYFEKSYDRFNKNAQNIYRVPISYSGSFANVPKTAANHPAVGPAMKKDFPEVLDYTRLVNVSLFMNASTMTYQSGKGEPRTFNEGNIYIADASFFNVFSYPLAAGDRKTCLTAKNTMVVSEATAKKYFGTQDPIGKVIQLNGIMPFKVTGVFKDIPENSHIKFDMLISFETVGHDWGLDMWTWPEFYNYVVLAPNTDVKKLEAKFPAFIEKYLGKTQRELNFKSSFDLQPITDIHLKSNLLKEAEANGSEKEIYFLGIIGAFILFIAWINYVNLSTAKSIERAKEVGLRKVVGAIKNQLVSQFLLESLIINIIALFIATGIILAFVPVFNSFIGKDISAGFFSTGLGSEPTFWLSVLGVFCAGALLVGAYPAFVLSSYLPAKVLKGLIIQSRSGISLRRVLVSFQFALSIILIAATFVVVKQFNYMRNGNLGYKKDQVLVVKAPVIADTTIFTKYDYFKSEIHQETSVTNATATSDIPGNMIRYRNSVRRANQDKQHNFTTYLMEIDEHFVPTYHIEMAAGQNFDAMDQSKMDSAGVSNVMVNEEVVTALGYKNAAEAIDKDIKFTLGQYDLSCKIVGVVKNFHQRSLKEKFDPILFYYPTRTEWKYISVNVKGANAAKSIANVEKLYKKAFPGNPFEYFFLDEYFNRQYQADSRLANVFGLFSVLAVIVACMGLLGLSSFVIRLRTKEIGIRKVLGASVSGLLVLISRDFVKLVCIASLIAIPIIYFTAKSWLDSYAFHMGLGISVFLVPPILLLTLTLLTICVQSLKTALMNPVRSLRSE